MRNDNLRLGDILESIERIEKHAASEEDFRSNELVQTWVLHHLRIIGESARSLSSEFREAHQDIPWSKIIGMRHILVHHYFDIDQDVVWSVVSHDIPELKASLLAIRGSQD